MLAINVPIPNLIVARLEQFLSPQLQIQRQPRIGLTENKLSFIRNPHVVISRQSPFAVNVVPKLVAMATCLGHSISAISSSDSLTPKTHPYELNSESPAAILQPKLYWLKFTFPTRYPKGTTDLRDGWDPLHVWCGRPYLATD